MKRISLKALGSVCLALVCLGVSWLLSPVTGFADEKGPFALLRPLQGEWRDSQGHLVLAIKYDYINGCRVVSARALAGGNPGTGVFCIEEAAGLREIILDWATDQYDLDNGRPWVSINHGEKLHRLDIKPTELQKRFAMRIDMPSGHNTLLHMDFYPGVTRAQSIRAPLGRLEWLSEGQEGIIGFASFGYPDRHAVFYMRGDVRYGREEYKLSGWESNSFHYYLSCGLRVDNPREKALELLGEPESTRVEPDGTEVLLYSEMPYVLEVFVSEGKVVRLKVTSEI